MTIGCSVAKPFAEGSLRERIAGTVVRLPGTGDGVARLVLVSMVKVDMRRPLATLRYRSQPRCRAVRARRQVSATSVITTTAAITSGVPTAAFTLGTIA